jgi:hypothetical protein
MGPIANLNVLVKREIKCFMLSLCKSHVIFLFTGFIFVK